MIRRWPALCVLTLSLLAAVHAADLPTTWPVPTSGSQWYRLVLLGQPSGYMSSLTRLVHDPAGAEQLQTVEHQEIKVAMAGQNLRIVSDQVTTYGRDLGPVRWQLRLDKMGVIQEVSARRVGDSLQVTSLESGVTSTQTYLLSKDFAGDVGVFWAVAHGDLQPGQTRTFQVFLPQLAALDDEVVTVGPVETLPVQGRPTKTFPLAIETKQLAMRLNVWVDEQGIPVRLQMPTLLGAQMDQVTQEQALAEIAPLVLSNSIALDQTLPAGPQLHRLTLQATALGQPLDQLLPTSPRQTLKLGAAGAGTLTITAQEPPPHSATLPVTTAELAPYLQSTRLAPADDPRIKELARQAVGDETDAYRAAVKLMAWTYQRLRKMESEPRPLTALQVLDQGAGDCKDHALLMATLARAVGLPSRFVVGLAAIGDHLYYHAWVEVWTGEWVELDPTWNEPLADAGHLRLGETALDDLSYSRANLDTGRTVGTLQLQVVDYR
ncbi:MAG TPA: transglutaminase-like domain-containing protein [Armatimonadota bacterium]|jgi:hypothetical protein